MAITDDYHIHYGADEAHATNAGRNADHAIQYTEAAAITVEVCYTGTAAPADLQVTGTLSPDATGYYRRNGTYNGQPCYERLDGAYWIWWGGREPPAGGLDEWVLGTTKGSSGDSWHAGWSISGTTSPAVAGDYWPNGTYDTYKDGVGTGPQMWTDNTGQYLTDTPTWDYMWAGDLMPNVYWRREGTYTPTAGGVGTPTGTAVCVAKPITSTYKPANGYPAAPSGDATITDISLSSITVTEDVQVDGGTFDGHDVDLYCKNTKGSKQNAIIITGTLSPDATGTYLPNGTYGGGGSTAYERTDGAYWIYEYYLSPTIRWWMMGVNKGDMVDAWRHWAWNLPVTGDDFDPIGTYTGTATAAWNTSELVLGEGVWHLSEWNTATNIVVGSDGNRICHTRRGPSQMEPLAHHAIEIGAF